MDLLFLERLHLGRVVEVGAAEELAVGWAWEEAGAVVVASGTWEKSED